ncbi:hypothetical protein RchiOBHm_Chr5g0032491 [Rosa chinensis]|uniref:Uncharacterized protein n=1 Tax=Rosa chinensis TaxID=74649 RepID=A0A2P6QAH8_ROSCH|nr:hypothetical protein RchiOBHm_Chr5g0032491 [Rosa chinensis]
MDVVGYTAYTEMLAVNVVLLVGWFRAGSVLLGLAGLMISFGMWGCNTKHLLYYVLLFPYF